MNFFAMFAKIKKDKLKRVGLPGVEGSKKESYNEK